MTAGWLGFAAGAEGCDKLNAEDAGGGEATGENVCCGAGAGAEGIERSSRSPMPPMLDEAASFEGAGVLKEEKLLRPAEGLAVRFWTGGDLGFESKKLPPPPNMVDEDVEAGDFVLEKASRPEKGEGEGLGAGAALKERLLKASFMPPKADCVGEVCDWGDARPPNDSCRACC